MIYEPTHNGNILYGRASMALPFQEVHMNAFLLRQSSRGIDRITPQDRLLQDRKIFFSEEVTRASADELISCLLALQAEDDKAPVTIFINSPGGEVDSGLAAYDTIMAMTCPVTTIVSGIAASMGSIIFLAGSKRLCLPHSELLLHDPLLTGSSGSKSALQLEKESSHIMQTREILGKIIADRTGRTLDEVYEITKEDTYMSATEALEFGVATGILTPKGVSTAGSAPVHATTRKAVK